MTATSLAPETAPHAPLSAATAARLAQEAQWGARNYRPLPLVVREAAGAWVTDVDGRRYLACLSA